MSLNRVKGFDGIRGIAAVAVVVHHTWIGRRNLGEIPVEVFFVLSGFLICGILHTARLRIEAEKSNFGTELYHFWVNRGLRILPLYYSILALTIVAGIAFGMFQDELHHLVWYVLYLQNFLIAFETKQFGTIGHTWTLAVEQQFYILSGVLMLVVPARRHLLLLGAGLILTFAGTIWARSAVPFPGSYVLPLRSFVPIICGGMASIAMNRRGVPASPTSRNVFGLTCCVALAGLSLLPANPTFIPYFDIVALVSVSAFSSLLLVDIARNQGGIVAKVLDIAVLRWLGALSYGIYIIHGIVRSVTLQTFQMPSSVRTFALVLVISVALAHTAHILIELPALRMKYRMRRPKEWTENGSAIQSI